MGKLLLSTENISIYKVELLQTLMPPIWLCEALLDQENSTNLQAFCIGSFDILCYPTYSVITVIII